MKRRHTYEHMTPEQLSKALDDLGLGVRKFAYLSGAKENTVKQWVDGTLDIPHWAFVMLTLLHLPNAIEMARKVTELMAHDREDEE